MIPFEQALAETENCKRYLLLGNGFSISLFPDCFSYTSLFEEAKDNELFANTIPLERAFEALETIDFEQVMEALKSSVKLVALYDANSTACKLMQDHAELLKEILVQAIAGRHPARPDKISEQQYQNCKAFLSQFIGLERGKSNVGKVFTVNYDLLLYWASLHDIMDINWKTEKQIHNPKQALSNNDGFRLPEDDYNAPYVAWDQFSASHSQTITYLHGALHLFERGPELAKLCWERAGNHPLMDQIRSALNEDRYPMFVSEDTSKAKMAKINKSAYLSKALRSFSGCCDTKGAALFVIGHSLAANDAHIFKRITRGKIGKLYVSIFGNPENESNRQIIAKANALAAGRDEKSPLNVSIIDASGIHIWNH